MGSVPYDLLTPHPSLLTGWESVDVDTMPC